MKSFVQQKVCPTKKDPYFVREAYGGYSQCIAGNPLKFTGSVLSNCVGYAWGRAAQLEGNPKCDIGVPSSRLKAGKHNPTSAWAWMMYTNGRKTGKTPKLGAVAVWKHKTKSNYGHVAVVEEVFADGSWMSSESAYGGTAFANRRYNKNSDRANYKFLGFIYLKVDLSPEPVAKFPKGTKVQILSTGNSRADGKGKVSKGIGYKRYVLAWDPTKTYPYKIGSKLGIVTGYYKETALKKI